MGRPFNHIQTIPQVLEYYRDSDSILCRVEKMPLTDRGKIDYDRLEAVITEQPEEDLSSADDMEQMLCGLFADVLKLKTAGADASFFELGGNSLKAFVVLSRLQERGIALTLRDLLRHPTPRALAAEIRRRNPSDTSAQDGTAEEAGGKIHICP